MPEKVIHEIRLNQYIACPADRIGRFSLGTSDSYGVEQLRIVPGEGWDGLMITATFHPPASDPVQAHRLQILRVTSKAHRLCPINIQLDNKIQVQVPLGR